jgi:EmrB/QacA subfamily drug resistance transporter
MAVLPALMLAMLLAMLDNMIVGTAMPRIVGELNGLEHFTWVTTAYVLGTTVSTPLWGKIGDLYGRKNIFLTSIVLFLVGSALCGMSGLAIVGGNSGSNGMLELIGFRALQGLGAGGLIVSAMAIIGDLVPPRERGRYQGMMGGVMAAAMVAGPLIGGFITDNLSWRWAFYVNLPVGAIALVLLWFRLHLPKYRTEHRIDWLGAGLLSVGITAVVLFASWGGTQYPWSSPVIVTLGLLGVASLTGFIWQETRSPEPIVPLGLFKNRNFSVVAGVGFLLGFAMFGAISFLPLYQQSVQGASATNSGLLLLPMMGGMLVTSIGSGQFITRTGRYRFFPFAGGVIMTVAMVLLTQLTVTTSKLQLSLMMIVLGIGMGFLFQTTMLIAQNSVEQKDLGVASSAATFFRSIGGSFGIALFGTIFNRALQSDLNKTPIGAAIATQMDKGTGGRIEGDTLRQMPAEVRDILLSSLTYAINHVFVLASIIAVLIPVLAAFIKHVALRSSNDADAAAAAKQAEMEEAAGDPVDATSAAFTD